MDGYRDLASAVVVQAIIDYQEAAEYLKRHPHTDDLDYEAKKDKDKRDKSKIRRLKKIIEAEDTLKEVESFFKSQWGEFLSPTDNETILQYLRKGDFETNEFKRILN